MNTPTLETPRLRLRRHEARDFPRLVEMWADPRVVQHIGGQVSNEQRSWARMLTYRGHWELLGFGYWAVEEKSSGLYVGEAGFADFKREITPSIAGVPEAGWAFLPASAGQGYATEAVRAAVAWLEANLQPAKSVCIIEPANLASIRVAEKCGFRRAGTAEVAGTPLLLFSRERPA